MALVVTLPIGTPPQLQQMVLDTGRAGPKPVKAGLEHRASKFWGPVIFFL